MPGHRIITRFAPSRSFMNVAFPPDFDPHPALPQWRPDGAEPFDFARAPSLYTRMPADVPGAVHSPLPWRQALADFDQLLALPRDAWQTGDVQAHIISTVQEHAGDAQGAKRTQASATSAAGSAIAMTKKGDADSQLEDELARKALEEWELVADDELDLVPDSTTTCEPAEPGSWAESVAQIKVGRGIKGCVSIRRGT